MSRTALRPLALLALPALAFLTAAPSPVQQAPGPPPQESLEIPPIIDPARTAVLSGFVPTVDPEEAEKRGRGAGAGESPGAGRGAPGGAAAEEPAEVRRSVVWVIPTAGSRVPRQPMQTMIAAPSGFSPTTIALTPGTAVDLRMNDTGVRIVRGEGLMRFERRLTRDTRALPVVPERPGAIDLSMRDNDEAKGLIVCVESPFLTVAGADGSFRIVGLPPGRRQVRIRLPEGKVLERTVDLTAGQELEVDWRRPG